LLFIRRRVSSVDETGQVGEKSLTLGRMSELHILHLEDNTTDAELIQLALQKAGIGCDIKRVETRSEFQASLEHRQFDLIISDFTLPAFDGMTALEIAHEKCPEVPFIFVSGTIGEDLAVDSLTQGATDYVLKDRLSRLVTSVQRASREQEPRPDRQRRGESVRPRNKVFRQMS